MHNNKNIVWKELKEKCIYNYGKKTKNRQFSISSRFSMESRSTAISVRFLFLPINTNILNISVESLLTLATSFFNNTHTHLQQETTESSWLIFFYYFNPFFSKASTCSLWCIHSQCIYLMSVWVLWLWIDFAMILLSNLHSALISYNNSIRFEWSFYPQTI